jgi:integrase
MLMITGQRLNEVARATWSEVGDLERALWIVLPDRMKVDEGAHTVPLTPLALELLRDLPRYEKDRHVFSTTKGDRPFSGFSKAKAALDAVVDLPHWTHQDLRRTVRTRLSGLGVRREVAEEVIAHTKPGILKRYDIHEYDAEKRDALEKWDRRLREIINGGG